MAKNYFVCEVCNPAVPGKHQRLIRAHLETIRDRRHALAETRKILETRPKLRPAECDSITGMLRTFLEAVRDFKELLKDGSKLPQRVAAKRYPLFVSLNSTERHILEILPLLSSFRKVCLQSSDKTYKMLAQIRDKVSVLLRSSETLEPETRDLLASVVVDDMIILPVWTQSVKYNN